MSDLAMLTKNSNQAIDQLINLALPRLEKLWHRLNTMSGQEKALMWESLDQLSHAFEEISVAIEELHQRTEELEAANVVLAKEHHRYRELFEFAPCSYLVTDFYAVIQEANQAAATLLNIETLALIGKPLSVFVSKEARRDFLNKINQLQQGKKLGNWQMQIQPYEGVSFSAMCIVSVIEDSQQRVLGFRWLLHNV